MQHLRSLGRASLLAISVLSACAMVDSPAIANAGVPATQPALSGAFGHYLAGQFAMSQSDPGIAADELLKALAAQPGDQTLLRHAFIATVMSGRPEAVQLARQLPNNQMAQLVLGDHAARTGHWQEAEQRFRSLPQQGLMQLLKPLLVAWAQQGAGHTQQALDTLQPYTAQDQRFRGIFALHAGMIADLGGQVQQAAQLYHIAQQNAQDLNLRMTQILASWEARSGNRDLARHMLSRLGQDAPDLSIIVPGLIATDGQRSVQSATDGIAEAYLGLAGSLPVQDMGSYGTLLLRLALNMRPDFTAARLVGAEFLAGQNHDAAALRMLASIPDSDPLAPLVELRRASLNEHLGHTGQAMDTLHKLAAAYPDNPIPLIVQGDILRGDKQYRSAITAYSHAIALIGQPGQHDWGVFYSRGIAYDQAHEWPKAEADFLHALHLSPDQPAVLNYLGYSWADRDTKLVQARAMIQKALQRDPNSGAITDSLGWVMLRQGDDKEAVKMLQRAVELDPEDSTINGHLGDAYWAVGRKLEAQYQWRRALTLNPTPSDAASLTAKLQRHQPKETVISGQ